MTEILEKIKANKVKVAIIGLGYVGMPLAAGFAKKGIHVIGYDISELRIKELKQGHDRTNEIDDATMKSLKNIIYTTDEKELADADVYLITVPTPVDEYKVPDLKPIIGASEAIGRNFGKGKLVILESTVYPGVTEEIIVPMIEKLSGLKYPQDFKAGYSPERINPGDKEHTVYTITKVVSGTDFNTLEAVDELYKKVVQKTFRAKSIRIAEAAKVIENTQRDINIALVNELTMLFDKMGLSIWDVLEASRTKWNFIDFKPGLVGGHCIPEDPYYLVHRAVRQGFHPQLISAGRRINDNMHHYVVDKLLANMNKSNKLIKGATILILGLTFKENVPDLRHSLTFHIIDGLKELGAEISVYEPWIDIEDVKRAINGRAKVLSKPEGNYDCVIVSVAHRQFKELGETGIAKLCKKGGIVFDIRHFLDEKKIGGATYLSL